MLDGHWQGGGEDGNDSGRSDHAMRGGVWSDVGNGACRVVERRWGRRPIAHRSSGGDATPVARTSFQSGRGSSEQIEAGQAGDVAAGEYLGVVVPKLSVGCKAKRATREGCPFYFQVVPEIGVEPTTFALRMRCSTN